MSVSTSALYAIMFLCAAFVFSFLFRVLRALLLHPALLAPLVRRSDGPDSTINVRTVLVISAAAEDPPARAAEGEGARGGGGTVGKGLGTDEIARHSDLIRYREVKEERRVEEREMVVVEMGEREEREQVGGSDEAAGRATGGEGEKVRVGREGGVEVACEAEGQRETDREVEKARAAEAVREQGSEGVVWRGGSGDPCECLVQTQAQARQEKHGECADADASAAVSREAGGAGAGGGRGAGNGVGGALAVECSVCLAEFRDEESVRRLHCCHHMFHQACIDGWLQAHTSCPLCRSSVVPPKHHHQCTS
ncbi:hypothetical protein CLOP_g1723 [Closterium sp. NIES-67]|nr:hypothetical protein CLOP_g1723 [Closterium sp. NIES-67]